MGELKSILNFRENLDFSDFTLQKSFMTSDPGRKKVLRFNCYEIFRESGKRNWLQLSLKCRLLNNNLFIDKLQNHEFRFVYSEDRSPFDFSQVS